MVKNDEAFVSLEKPVVVAERIEDGEGERTGNGGGRFQNIRSSRRMGLMGLMRLME
jgi:hypothetical protein